MPVTFGSVGDIISVSLLVKDLLIALNDSRGSSAEYQAVVRELYILDTALLEVEQLSRSRATTPELHALYETAKQTVTKCRDSVAEFTVRIKKYSGSLAVGGSGNILKDTARKIQWRASQKDEEIAKFRTEVTGYSHSINMLLATGMVKLLSTKNDDLKDQLAEDGRRTHAALDIHIQALKEVRIRLDDNRQLISAGNSLASRIMDRLEWIQKLGSELKRFMSNVIAGNIAIYREIVALRSAFSKHVDRPLLEEPFVLEDAIGRIAPVHLRFINSWTAFQAVMEIRFQGKQGLRKICRKEYVLQESATGREVDLSLDFEDAFLPGQKITMSLVFKRDSAEQSTQTSAHCPRCNALSGQPTNVDVLCSACNMWFRRITEIHEVDLLYPTARNTKVHFGEPSFGRVQFGPKPLKRKLEEVDGEDGDYSRFKRIRVVSEAKRVKAPKIFTEAKQTRAFYTPGENGNHTPKLFKINVSESAVDMDWWKKTLELAQSKHNGADNNRISYFRDFDWTSYLKDIDADLINEIVPRSEANLGSVQSKIDVDWTSYLEDIDADLINEIVPRSEANSGSVQSKIVLASAPNDETVEPWDAGGGCSDEVRLVAFSHNSARLATYDTTVKIWDTSTGECLQTLNGRSDEVRLVAFSPDSARLASASGDSTVRIWDVSTGECLQTLNGHSDQVRSVAFSPDSARLASASGDSTVRIWDVSTGECLQTLDTYKALFQHII